MGNFVISAAGEVLGVNFDVLEMVADEEEVGAEELSELIEMDGLGLAGCFVGAGVSVSLAYGRVGALVAEGGEGSDEEMEKLLVGGENFDGGEEVVVKLVPEDAGGFAEGLGTFGEEGDFSGGAGRMKEMVEIHIRELGKVEWGCGV